MEKINSLSCKFAKFGCFGNFLGRKTALFALVIFLVGGGGVWGQTWNESNPTLDADLLKYSMYATDVINGNSPTSAPTSGLVGTAGKVTGTITLFSERAYFNQIAGQVKVGGLGSTVEYIDNCQNINTSNFNSALYYGSIVSGGSINTTAHQFQEYPMKYDIKAGGTATQTSIANAPSQFGGRYPTMPNLSGINFDTSVSVNTNWAVSYPINAGIHKYKDLKLGGTSVMTINPTNGSYKTIIYVAGDLVLNANAKIIPADPNAAAGQILYIVKGTNVTITANTSGCDYTTIYGTIIAPNATVKFGHNSKIVGQVLAKELDLTGFSGAGGLTFASLSIAQATSENADYPEDATWSNKYTLPPSYSSGSWSYTKNRDHIVQHPVKIDFPADYGSNTASISYTVEKISGPGIVKNATATLPANTTIPPSNSDERNGADNTRPRVIVPTNGTISFNRPQSGSGEVTSHLPIVIVDNGITEGDFKFKVTFSSSVQEVGVPNPVEITVKSDDPDRSTGQKPTVTTSGFTAIKEQVVTPANLNPAGTTGTGWFRTGTTTQGVTTYGAGQQVGTITATKATYSGGITFTIDTNSPYRDWFNFNYSNAADSSQSATISTTANYAANRETLTPEATGAATIQFNVTADDQTNSPNDAGKTTTPVTVTIDPWNDVAFTNVTPGSLVFTITESLTAPTSNSIAATSLVFTGSDDRPTQQSARTFSNNNTNVGGIVATTNGGANAQYSISATGKLNPSNYQNVAITVRDTATYGFATDYFDARINVPVTIVRANLYSPVANAKPTVKVKEDEFVRITIASLSITDNDAGDGVPAHSNAQFVLSTAASARKTKENANITFRIDNGDLIYDLTQVAKSYEFNNVFRDTITVQLENTNTTGDKRRTTTPAQIFVEIIPINDIAPTAQDFSVTAISGISETFGVPDNKHPTDNDRSSTTSSPTNSGTAGQFITRDAWKVNDINTSETNDKVDVIKTDKGFTISVNNTWNSSVDGEFTTFKYNVIDSADYHPGKHNVSDNWATCTVYVEINDKDFIIPQGDTIYITQPKEGDTAVSVLWNGYKNLGENDIHSLGYNKAGAVFEKLSNPKYGVLDLDPSGTFVYTLSDLESEEIENFDVPDEFYYRVKSPSSGVWNDEVSDGAHAKKGIVYIYVNQINKDNPELKDKKDYATVDAQMTFKAIDQTQDIQDRDKKDFDLDKGTILVVDGVTTDGVFTPKNLAKTFDETVLDEDSIDIELSRDGTLKFKYTGDFLTEADLTEIVISYSVNDSLNRTHRVSRVDATPNGTEAVDGQDPTPWYASTKQYNVGSSHPLTFTIVLYPNPRAVDYEMELEEEKNSKILYIDGYTDDAGKKIALISLSDSIARWFDDNLLSIIRFTLDGENGGAQHGTVSMLDSYDGVVEYSHTVGEALSDEFTYILYFRRADGSQGETKGKVSVKMLKREPRFGGEEWFYEDTDGNGMVDKITAKFDRAIVIKDTEFEVTFDNRTIDVKTPTTYVKIEDEDGNVTDDSTAVVITLYEDKEGGDKNASPQDVTSNEKDKEMNLKVTHTQYVFDGKEREAVIMVEDKAAPVIKGKYARYIESVNDKDTLVLKMSELINNIVLRDNNFPLRFTDDPAKVSGEKFTDIQDRTIEFGFEGSPRIENGDYYLTISSRNIVKLEEGDFVYINWEADEIIEDIKLNKQNIKMNKRVKILKEIVAAMDSAKAYYFDLGSDGENGEFVDGVYDGYIDLIRIDLGDLDPEVLGILDTIAPQFASKLSLSKTRFGENYVIKETDVSVVDGKIELRVKENPAAEYPKMSNRTALLQDDKIILTEDVKYNLLTIMKSKNEGVIPIDKVAPVVLFGEYEPKDSTLKVVFSEPIETVTEIESPYKFLGKFIDGKEYSMTFAGAPTKKGNDTLSYKVASVVDNSYPLNGDSLWIDIAEGVSDVAANVQTHTVKAPLKVGRYVTDVEVHIVPQPFILGERLPKSLMDYYNQSGDDRGVAIIVEAKGPVSDMSRKWGTLMILDQTGNSVREYDIMPAKTDNNVIGFAIWDGKNSAFRTVGASSYLAVVEVEVKFDDGSSIKKTPRKIIVVKQGSKVQE